MAIRGSWFLSVTNFFFAVTAEVAGSFADDGSSNSAEFKTSLPKEQFESVLEGTISSTKLLGYKTGYPGNFSI